MLAAFAALHPVAQLVSTASLETFRDGEVTPQKKIIKQMQTKRKQTRPSPSPPTPPTSPAPRSPVHTDLWTVRNVRPGVNTRWDAWVSVLYAGLDPMLGKGAVDVEAS
ncbi:hypothetical protein K438DRAFT_1982083 [Mycena galopus ATCC 62051]|nr:hypothetical protein K438DRAFT_1982083 [Mycena galopus ATCC 62051]